MTTEPEGQSLTDLLDASAAGEPIPHHTLQPRDEDGHWVEAEGTDLFGRPIIHVIEQ